MGVDVRALWGDIHDVVIKTLVAIEAQVNLLLLLPDILRNIFRPLDVFLSQRMLPSFLCVLSVNV